MKKLLRRVSVLGFGWLVGPLGAAHAQQPAQAGPTAAALTKNFALIEAGTEGESKAFD